MTSVHEIVTPRKLQGQETKRYFLFFFTTIVTYSVYHLKVKEDLIDKNKITFRIQLFTLIYVSLTIYETFIFRYTYLY